jgi:peptide/nickel transport system substrate-binding protein
MTKLRLGFTLLVALGLAVALGSVARSSAAANRANPVIPVLRVGDTVAFSTLDPTQNQGETFWGVFDELLRLTPDGRIVPNLAQSVGKPGPAVYVYHLRHGVKFWDGKEMTADDVVNSLNYYRYPTFQTSAYYRSVKSIVAKDKYTVVVTLKHVDSSWDSVLSWQGPIFEKAFQQAHKATFGKPGTGVMATGAFEVQSFDPTTGLELTANPHWWRGPVNVKHVSWKFFQNETSEALAFRAGQIDVAFPFDAKAFGSTAATKLVNVPSNTTGYFGMNFQQAPFNDVHVRRAVADALNKEAIINAVGVPSIPAKTLIPPNQLRTLGTKAQVDAVVKSVPQYGYDLAKAKAELAKSKYPHGFTTTTDTVDFGAFVNINQAISAQLAKIGINLKVNVISAAKWLAEVYGAKTYSSLFTTVTLITPDPSAYPQFMLGSKNASNGGGNFANYDPAVVDALLKQSTTISDHAKRLAVYQKMLQQIANDAAYIPLYQQDESLALSSCW